MLQLISSATVAKLVELEVATKKHTKLIGAKHDDKAGGKCQAIATKRHLSSDSYRRPPVEGGGRNYNVNTITYTAVHFINDYK